MTLDPRPSAARRCSALLAAVAARCDGRGHLPQRARRDRGAVRLPAAARWRCRCATRARSRAAQADALADEQLDFVIQIWTVDGRSIYASRPHASLPARALLGLADARRARPGLAHLQRRDARARDPGGAAGADPAAARGAGGAAQRPAAAADRRRCWRSAIWWLAARTLAPLRRLAGEVRARDAAARWRRCGDGGLPDEVAPLVAGAQRAARAAARVARRAARLRRRRGARAALAAHRAQAAAASCCARAGDEADEREAAVAALGRRHRARRPAGRAAARAGAQRAGRAAARLRAGRPGARSRAQAVADDACRSRRRAASSFELARRRAGARRRRPAWRSALLVRNLVDNAARYSPRGLARRGARRPRRAAGAMLQVDDAGPGIPAAERERVFDRFYRARRRGDGPAAASAWRSSAASRPRTARRVELGGLAARRLAGRRSASPCGRRAGRGGRGCVVLTLA